MSYRDFIKQFNKDYFDNLKTSNYKMPYYREWAYPLLEQQIKKCLEEFKDYNIDTVLVIGCARGFEVEIFSLLNKKAIGIDISSFAVRSVKSQEQLLLGDVSYLPFQDNTFDLVYSAELLEHIPEERVNRSIKELQRIASYAFLTINTTPLAKLDKDFSHITIHNRKWWENRLFIYYDYISFNYKFKQWDIFSLKRKEQGGM